MPDSPDLTFRRRTVYRKGGQFVRKGTKGAKRELYEIAYQAGAAIGGRRVYRAREVLVKATEPGAIDSPANPARRGSIHWALARTNVLTSGALRDARRVEVTIKGKDYRTKEKRIKLSLEPKKNTRLADFLVGKVVEAMARRGFRPAYELNIVNWARTKISKTAARKKRQLYDTQIVVKVYK